MSSQWGLAHALYFPSPREFLHHVGIRNIHAMESIEHGKVHLYTSPVMPQIENPSYDAKSTVSDEAEYIDKPKKDFNIIEKVLLKESVQNWCRNTKTFEYDLKWAYYVLKGQCNDGLIVMLQTYDSYDQVDADADPIKLLNLIQRVCFKAT